MAEVSTRDEFLKTVWKPYPPLKWPLSEGEGLSTGSTAGRITAISDQSISILKGKLALNFKIGQLDSCSSQTNNFLQMNDIVQIWFKDNQVEKIELLVPSQGALPQFSNSRFIEALPKALTLIRSFFTKLEFFETRTPYLVPSPGMEPHLEPFETTFKFGSQTKTLFLPTSPEFHLKKALAGGFEKVFEIKECFRNEEISETHQAEFCMLEYYRAYSSLNDILVDLSRLTVDLCKDFQVAAPKIFESLSMQDLWKKATGFNLSPKTQSDELISFFNLEARFKTWDFDDIFNFIFIEKVEPVLLELSQVQPIFLTNYPPSQAALSRINRDGWAERAEMYWKGLEIANGFDELNDPDVQVARYNESCEVRTKNQRQVIPIDQGLIECLKYGMPPSAGIAVGVERLLMAVLGVKEISKLRLFPVSLK